ncbi:Uncharacterized conserved protein YbjT, contains NAD(P)-binding and DUF2867 domains [Microlunatus flavus]|uniref:Uncharacterized conserved protein YbjT, contains NAD(P)-binding and DUF2867 domains n=1 Tax=Microlunatus flavus TaxID=1036181 RepID=A0A1H9N4F4_9ACTN|nr:Uncharacterized conserved protein YbjT, contains NAD(P)-binding and DUF2867 domains [Microlunatus flavus]
MTGATGNVGRQVVEQLAAAGEPVRALSRHPERSRWPDGVEAVAGDLVEGVPAEAFTGVRALHLFPAPEGVEAVVAAAKAAGVAHVSVLSSLSASWESDSPLQRRHTDVERAVEASGLGWTMLRPGMFMTNTLAWAPAVRAGEPVRAPYGDSVAAPVHEADIAAVAVAALLHPQAHAGAAYELSGPEALSQRDRVRILSEVLGREVRFEEQDRDEARADLLRNPWMSAQLADSLLDMQERAVGVREGQVLPAVEQVLGRPGLPFARWAADHREAFAPVG